MSFERKVAIQTIISAMLLGYCLIISKTETAILQKEYINKAVNISDTKKDIKKMFIDIYEISKNGIEKCGEYIGRVTDKIGTGFASESQNTVMAQPAVYPEPPEQILNQKDTASPDQEIQPATEEPVFRIPLEGRITSPFGERVHPVENNTSVHYGTDIAGNTGDCVISSSPGTVEETGYDDNLGNYVKISHSAELMTVYGHLSDIMVKKGEYVDENTKIGTVGSTGVATGPHLHFEVRHNGKSVDPGDYLSDL